MVPAFVGIAIAALFLLLVERDPHQRALVGITVVIAVVVLLAIRLIYVPLRIRRITSDPHFRRQTDADQSPDGQADVVSSASAPPSPKGAATISLLPAIRSALTPESIAALVAQGADLEAVDDDGWTVLRWAAAYSQSTEAVTALLSAGANTESRDRAGMTALMYAAWENANPDVVTALLKAGADAKARSKENRTALDYARDNASLQGTDALRALEDASK